jgi:Flp pilus assembly protein TadD
MNVRVVPVPSRLHRVATILIEAGWLAAVVLVPLTVNPWGYNHELHKAALLQMLVLLMAAVHVVALAWSPQPAASRRWLRRPLVLPILLVAGAILLSTVASLSPLVSLWGPYYGRRGAHLLLTLILWALLVAAHLRTPAQRRRLVAAIVIAGSLVALAPFLIAVAPFAEVLRRGGDLLTGRPGGTLVNPIFLGAYLIIVIPFTLAKVVTGLGSAVTRARQGNLALEGRWLTFVKVAGWGAALILQLFTLLIAQSRGPWLGALVGVVVFAVLVLWPTHRRLVLLGLAVGTLLVGGVLAGLNFDVARTSRLSQLPYVRRVVGATDLSGGTVRVRLVLWQAAWKVVTTWPEVGLAPDPLHALRPLAGYGPELAVVAYNTAYSPELAHIENPDLIWDRSHNQTLDLLAMRGWLGLATVTVLGVACAWRGLALWRAADDWTERIWVAVPLAALVAHVVEVQFAFSVTATEMMSWLCVAWLASPSDFSGRKGGAESPQVRAGAISLRWRIYAVVAAVLLVILAVRLEGGSAWAGALVARGRALSRIGGWGESIEMYDQALSLVPWEAATYQFRAEALYNLALVLPEEETDLKAQLFEAVDRDLAYARRLEPLELEYYTNSAILHAYWSETIDPTHLDTAVAFYRQAFRLAPTRAELRIDLGHVYHNHARYAEALAEYDAALEIDPQFATAYYDSGVAWLALDRPDLARPAFQAALELAPDCEACRDALRTLEE